MVVSTDMQHIAWLSARICSTLHGCQHGNAAHCMIVSKDMQQQCMVVSTDVQHNCMVVSTDMRHIAWLSSRLFSTLHGCQPGYAAHCMVAITEELLTQLASNNAKFSPRNM
jgi:hypothetical protein